MKRLLLLILLVASSALTLACATTGLPQGVASFRIESNVPDATVWVDDVMIGTAKEWQEKGKHIRAGFHRIEIRHPGYYSYFTEMELEAGADIVVRAQLREMIE